MTLARPYKENSPQETINNIRKILFDLNLTVYETMWQNPADKIFSVRLDLGEKYDNWGTNGKGTSRIYCLASAYGEFIERLQNRMFISSAPKPMLDRLYQKEQYYLYPDERIICKTEFQKLPPTILDDCVSQDKDIRKVHIDKYFKILDKYSIEGTVGVPFMRMQDGKLFNFPYSHILNATGSTGMCAGNTKEEALFQGICEIFERYALSEVFYNFLCPPTIEKSYLENYPEELDIINQIEASSDLRIIVKDFSLGKQFPVVGVLVINEKKKLYRLNAGSDTDFKVALRRSLTEVFQGHSTYELFESIMKPIPSDELDIFKYKDEKKMKSELIDFYTNGRGHFPSSIFGTDYSWSFSEETFLKRKNYEEELKHFEDICQRFNKDIYVRDVSFLGFPSYHIFIPDWSSKGKRSIDYNADIEVSEISYLFFYKYLKVKNVAVEEEILDEIASLVGKLNGDDGRLSPLLGLEFKDDSDWSDIAFVFFLALAYLRIGNFVKAKVFFLQFLEQEFEPSDIPDYYTVALEYITLKSNGYEVVELGEKLRADNTLCGDTVEQVISDLSNTENIFKEIKFPICPDCERCSLNSECLTRLKLDIACSIHTEMKKTAKEV